VGIPVVNRTIALSLAGVLLSFAAACLADGTSQRRLTPDDMAKLEQLGAGPGTSGMAGIRTTVLSGDPTRPGLYTIRLSVPAHLRIEAHVHRDQRSAVVVSGHWSIGYGDRFDASALKLLPPGSFYTEPAEAPHFASTGAEPVVVYISGVGPTDTRFQHQSESNKE
jgi:uncharacterized RmlC-like cupin family protein